MYTVTQAARSANVSTTSIRNWAKLYADFLSPSANPPAGTPREFTAADLSVFTTVAVMRAQLVEPEAISAALDAGERLEPVRPPVEEPPADQAAHERRHQREAHLRRLMADVDKHWEAVDVQAKRGSASGYDQAVRALAELAEGHALTSSREEFERTLRQFVVRHATRGALLRRLTEAGLWSG